MSTSLSAANAYTRAAALIDRAATGAMPSTAKEAGEGSFAGVLQQAVNNVVEAGKTAESRAFDAAAGRADVVDVVTAVAETEVALETMVSIRDKVIAAYEEIMRMPI